MGAFYVITYGLSNKMVQIRKNPLVAITGEWFSAHGKGVDLGYFHKEENKEIADKLRTVFAEWIDNGHTDFSDEKGLLQIVSGKFHKLKQKISSNILLCLRDIEKRRNIC